MSRVRPEMHRSPTNPFVCVVLIATMAAGCASGPAATGLPGGSASPTVIPTAAVTPAATLTTLGPVDQPLVAGIYRLDLDKLKGSGPKYPAFTLTVPEGWATLGGWIVDHPRPGKDVPPIAVQFWDVDEVYGHPCQWKGTLSQPGPTVDDLAKALVDRPLRNATQPIDITLDGYAGKSLEWSVPADFEIDDRGDFPDCDLTDDGHRDFKSWTGKGWAGNRYQQGPGQVDRLWILDIDGARLVIDAFDMPSATSAERQELLDVVASIRFER
jgi:hypothetical protein